PGMCPRRAIRICTSQAANNPPAKDHVALGRLFAMPVLGDDNQEGGDAPFDVLSMISTVVVMALLLAFGVMMALKYDARGDDSTLSVGCSVKIHGLQSEKGKALNGKSGHITTELDVETGRHSVRLKGGRILAVKPGNLTLIAVQPAAGEGLGSANEGPARPCGAVVLVKICGACERELPKGAYGGGQWPLMQSSSRCEECVAAGNQLVLMKKGRTKTEHDECPICSLFLPLDPNHSIFQSCCSKLVCNGCVFRSRVRGMKDCPFCRTTPPKSNASQARMIQKRADAGDPAGISNLANQYLCGYSGLQKDVPRAVELYERAAELGDRNAHYNLAYIYSGGVGVKKDTDKVIRHWEKAAMLGHTFARHNLGAMEYQHGNHDLALQHLMISSKLGSKHSLDMIKMMFTNGNATKTDFVEALRGYQSAVEETRSPDRDEAIQRLSTQLKR
ncbi:hypothetical protein THAOC_16816, partial [Thalassiosira oceanica]